MKLLTLATVLALPAAPALAQQAELPMWMVGSWLSCADGRQVSETWQGDARGMLLGSTLTLGRRATFEFQRIARNDAGGITFYAQPGGAPATEFVARPDSGDGRLVFENLAHDFPQRVIYWREGDGLVGRIEGMLDGRAASEEWRYVRALPGQVCNGSS